MALTLRRGAPQPPPPPRAPTPLAAPVVLPTDRVYPSPALASRGEAGDSLVLTMTAQADCWVEVRADGATLVNRVLAQGESQTFEARGEIVLSVGNAGGLSIRVNDRPALPLGTQRRGPQEHRHHAAEPARPRRAGRRGAARRPQRLG